MIQETETSCRISIGLQIYYLNRRLGKGVEKVQIMIIEGSSYNDIVTQFKTQAATLPTAIAVIEIVYSYKADGKIIFTMIYK